MCKPDSITREIAAGNLNPSPIKILRVLDDGNLAGRETIPTSSTFPTRARCSSRSGAVARYMWHKSKLVQVPISRVSADTVSGSKLEQLHAHTRVRGGGICTRSIVIFGSAIKCPLFNFVPATRSFIVVDVTVIARVSRFERNSQLR